MQHLKSSWGQITVPILIGLACFFAIVGYQPLNPEYIGWILGRQDPSQHYFGWVFFRNTEWSLPPGLNPQFGLEFSNSIVYSDSIPLLAIFFKIFSKILPAQFQYFGIWILLCFVLQAWIAWLILSEHTNAISIKSLGICFFILAPPLLWRLNTGAGTQAALFGHFLILGSIYLNLRKRTNYLSLAWFALIQASLLTHFYLFFMVTLLWGANLIDSTINKTISIRKAALLLCVFLFGIALTAWLAGYFSVETSSGSKWGYHFFKVNLLGLFNSYGTSTFVDSLPIEDNWGEGYVYLGLGVFCLLVAALPGIFKFRLGILKKIQGHPSFVLALALLLLFSTTNEIDLGTYRYTLEVPEHWLDYANFLRASGRCFLPVFYTLLILILCINIKSFQKKFLIHLLLGVSLILQAIDLAPLIRGIQQHMRTNLSSDNPLLKLQDSFWNQELVHQKIKLAPAKNLSPLWTTFSKYATEKKLSTNAVFLARLDEKKLNNVNFQTFSNLSAGKFDPDSIFIADDSYVIPILLNLNKQKDLFIKIDGLNVLVPNGVEAYKTWNLNNKDKAIDSSYFYKVSPYSIKPSKDTGDININYYLTKGWSYRESWGIWSEENSATLTLPIPSEPFSNLEIHLQAFMAGRKTSQSFEVWLNSEFYKTVSTSNPKEFSLSIPITPQLKKNRFLSIEFRFDDLQSPKELGIGSGDPRKLGIGLISASFI